MPPDPAESSREPSASSTPAWETVNGASVEFGQTFTRVGDDRATAAVAAALRPAPGWHSVIVHGDKEGFFELGIRQADGEIAWSQTHVNHVVEAVLSNPHYGGEPIRLISCHSGLLNNTAQEFANSLGGPVIGSVFRVGTYHDSPDGATTPRQFIPSVEATEDHPSLGMRAIAPAAEEFVLFMPQPGTERIDAAKAIHVMGFVESTTEALAAHGGAAGGGSGVTAGGAAAVLGPGGAAPWYTPSKLPDSELLAHSALGGLGASLGSAGVGPIMAWLAQSAMTHYIEQHRSEIDEWVAAHQGSVDEAVAAGQQPYLNVRVTSEAFPHIEVTPAGPAVVPLPCLPVGPLHIELSWSPTVPPSSNTSTWDVLAGGHVVQLNWVSLPVPVSSSADQAVGWGSLPGDAASLPGRMAPLYHHPGESHGPATEAHQAGLVQQTGAVYLDAAGSWHPAAVHAGASGPAPIPPQRPDLVAPTASLGGTSTYHAELQGEQTMTGGVESGASRATDHSESHTGEGGMELGASHSGHRDGGHVGPRDAGRDASGDRDTGAPDVVRDETGHVPDWHIYPRDAGPDGSQSHDAAVPDVPPVKEPDFPIPPGPGSADPPPYGQSADASTSRSDANYSGGDGNAYYTDGRHVPVSTTESSTVSLLPSTDFGDPHDDNLPGHHDSLPSTDFGDPHHDNLPSTDLSGLDSTQFLDSGFDGGHTDVGPLPQP